MLRLHPEVALHVLEQEHDFVKRLEKMAGFPLELRDDPLLKPDEIKLVVRGAQRDGGLPSRIFPSDHVALVADLLGPPK